MSPNPSHTLRNALVLAAVLVWPAVASAQLKPPAERPPWLKPWTPPVVSPGYRSPGDIHKLMVEKRGDALFSATKGRPLNALHYHDRTLLVVRSADLGAAASSSFATVRDDLNLIRLRDRIIDTTVEEPPVPDTLTLTGRNERQLHLVQFAGPVQPDWKKALEDSEGIDVVSYFPENAYLVWATPAARERLTSLAYVQPHVQWEGPFHPAYKLHPAFDRGFDGNVQATVQLYAHAGGDRSLSAIRERAVAVLKEPRRTGAFINIVIEVPASGLEAIARLDDVVNVEPFVVPGLFCERQAQIVAGSLSAAGTGPNAPGYLAWLNGLGFTSNFDFTVDVTDDGFDRGLTDAANVHPVFLDAGGASRVTYARRVSGTTVSTTNAGNVGGHGTIDASILAGLNQVAAGAPGSADHLDAAGYRHGLGVAPFARIGMSKVLGPWASPDYTTVLDSAHADGARISTNSWGNVSSPSGSYDAASQEYDGLVRDARPGTAPSGGVAGNQEMVIVFAAGNAGPGATTIGDFGAAAKNTLTVGASENFNATGDGDGSGIGNAGANDLRQVINFSSRGPTADGRIKPDIMAPGTHVFGAASQLATFNATSVSGGPQNNPGNLAGGLLYHPNEDSWYPPNNCNDGAHPGDGGTNPGGPCDPNQTLYTWSSGTSQATPAVAGGAALLRQWFANQGRPAPSPAMTKAYLMNAATYMTGPSDNLPSNTQGMGRMNLGTAFDNTPRLLFDQVKTAHSNAAADAAEVFTVTGTVADTTRPFRITMAYTDAPGNPVSGVIANNDLDLEVEVGGTVYRGNRSFTQGTTNPAGAATADNQNNVESVFLPAGTTGAFTVTVRPAAINSDGVPNNGDTTDQDFALVVYNGQFPGRDPVDTILVLDVSGSMSEIAPGGTATKIELLKDSVEMFVRAWQPFSIPDDRMGIVYFSTGIAGTVPAAAPLLLPFQANTANFIADVRGRSASGCTALGAGILTALGGFDTLPGRQRHIIVFTNGMQNRSPMVTSSSPRQIVADATAACGDSGIAGNPGVNLADYPVKAIHTIGVGAFGASWTTLLNGIASETGGVNHVTSTPDEDLEDFFIENLVTTLRVDPVEKVATRSGTLAAGQTNRIESFGIDGTVRKATFAVSWRGDRRTGAVGYRLVAPDGTVVPPHLMDVEEGPFYRVASVTFPLSLNSPVAVNAAGTSIPHAGTWKLVFEPHLQTPQVDYRVHLIVDEADIRYSFEVPTAATGVGEPIPMSLWVMKGTRTITGLQHVRAVVSRPPVGFGSFLSTNAVSRDHLAQPLTIGGDSFANAAMKKAYLLTQNDDLRGSLDPIVETIDFLDDGLPQHGDAKANDGVYSALYTNTQRPGTYRIEASFEGAGPDSGMVTRSESRTVAVNMKRFDAGKSDVDIRPAGDGAFQVTARLIDAFDNFLGPGQNVSVIVSPPGKKWGPLGRQVPLADRLDGSYSGRVELTPAELQGGYELLLTGDGIVFGTIPQQAGAGVWRASVHGGIARPVGAWNSAFDPGVSIAADLEYRLTPSLWAVGILELDRFESASPSESDTWWWSISPKLKYELGQSAIRPYVTAGLGAYIREGGSARFGVNAGLGLQYSWTAHWRAAAGLDGHRIATGSGGTRFVAAQIGLLYEW